MSNNPNPNWLCGRPLVFGDQEQIKELNRLSRQHEEDQIINLSQTDTAVTCPACKAVFDAAPQLLFNSDTAEQSSTKGGDQ